MISVKWRIVLQTVAIIVINCMHRQIKICPNIR